VAREFYGGNFFRAAADITTHTTHCFIPSSKNVAVKMLFVRFLGWDKKRAWHYYCHYMYYNYKNNNNYYYYCCLFILADKPMHMQQKVYSITNIIIFNSPSMVVGRHI